MRRTPLLLTVVFLAPALAPAQKEEASVPSVEQLVRRLGDEDFGKREAATRALRAAGSRALPSLRKALRHPDLEVRKRAGRLVAALEAELAFAATPVTVDVNKKPARDVLDDLTRQTDYRFLFVGGYGNNNPCTLRLTKAPFWQALDEVCARTGMVIETGQGGDHVYVSVEKTPPPPVHHDRAFRTVVNGCTTPAGGTARVGLTVYAEPKLTLLVLGPVKLEKALDQDGRSMLPPAGKGEGGQTFIRWGLRRYLGTRFAIDLVRPSEKSRSVKHLKGSLPVFAVIRRQDEVLTDRVGESTGKSFRVGPVNLHVAGLREGPAGRFTLTVVLLNEEAASGLDAAWTGTADSRILLLDGKGNRLYCDGSTLFRRGPGHLHLTCRYWCGSRKPAKLIYQHWHVRGTEVAFEFRDIPLNP
jgi:hypothetical protein